MLEAVAGAGKVAAIAGGSEGWMWHPVSSLMQRARHTYQTIPSFLNKNPPLKKTADPSPRKGH